jgi:hypothetical protein
MTLKHNFDRAWWCRPIISATEEVQVGRSQSETSSKQKDPIQKITKAKKR